MTFREPKLQEHVERVVSLVQGGPPEEIPVSALMDAWHFFHLVEGDESPCTQEALEHLLSKELRPALRGWYRRAGDAMNPSAIAFRDRLGQMAGECFG